MKHIQDKLEDKTDQMCVSEATGRQTDRRGYTSRKERAIFDS